MELKDLIKRAMEIKEKYKELEIKNYGREWNKLEIMSGLVGDVGDLTKLVMAKEGVREIESLDEKMEHELSDCLWCIFVLANEYGVDVEKEFMKTMDQLEKRIAEKLYNNVVL